MKSKKNLHKVLIALLCCVILAGLLITALTDRNEAPTAGWTQSGTCEWKIDDGVLTIRPLGDGSEGTLADWGTGKFPSPWADNFTIKAVVVKSGVKAATCRFMFAGCTALTSVDLSSFGTSQAADMSGMFYGCSALTFLDLSSFDTSNVTDTTKMFYECRNLISLDLSSFDTSNVTGMREMFFSCENLTSLDLNNFNTSQVTDMSGMFAGCEALTSLDLSSFDTGKVTGMREMFDRCTALKELILSANFSFKRGSNLPDPSNIAPYTGKWTNGAWSLTASQLTKQYNGSAMTGNWVWEETVAGWTQCGTCEWNIDDGVLTIRPLGDRSEGTLADWGAGSSPWVNNFDITSVVVKSGVKAATCHWMFFGCRNLTSLDLSSFDTSKVTDMTKMFYDCRNLTFLDLSSFDTSNVTNMSWMFYGCENLTSLDLSSFGTSKVTDMIWMFYGCGNLTSLDLSSFDTSRVTDMCSMFDECAALTALDLNSFDTGNVTNMRRMFRGCAALTALDMSSFDTSKVTDMRYMFANCAALTALDMGSFDTSKVTDMDYIFSGCNVLKELTLGGNFNFKSIITIGLLDPSNIAPYTGKWTNGAWSLTASQLTRQYNGSAMAGTWVWETERHTGFVPAKDGS